MSDYPDGHVFTDSAGITARYTRVGDIEPGMMIIVGWRSRVARVEHRDVGGPEEAHRVFTRDHEAPMTPWLPAAVTFPIEVEA